MGSGDPELITLAVIFGVLGAERLKDVVGHTDTVVILKDRRRKLSVAW